MPSKSNKLAASEATLPTIPKALVDQLVSAPTTGEVVNEACLAFKKALIERALGAEMELHLGYPPAGAKPAGAENHRNGSTGKTVLTDGGTLRIDVPRDRDGSFAPLLIPNHQRRLTGLTTRSSVSTRVVCRCARSRLSCWKPTAPR